jgi:hypothetical protein
MILYKTLIRPVTTHASETWVLPAADRKLFIIFERKLLGICGPIKDKN